MKKPAIGHVDCPVCPFKDAEVKEDKNAHAYIHCPDCNAQTFTRNDYRDGFLRKKMRPATPPDPVTVTGTEPPTPIAPTKAAPVPPVSPAPKTPKPSWFQPILAGGKP
jgi:hypothetical protein